MSVEESKISGVRKAAMLMLALGEEASAEIMKQLSPEEVEKIGEEIANLGAIEQDSAEVVAKEFVDLGGDRALRGGKDVAKKMLERSLGSEFSKKFADKIGGEAATHRLDELGDVDPEHLAKFIQNEHPQTIALVVSHLEPSQGAEVFQLLPEAMRPEVSVRMAGLEEISPQVLRRIGMVLDEKLRAFASFRRETSGGVRAVAELLNRLDRGISREVLDSLEESNPDVALSIRNLMFVFDDLLLLDDKAMREVLQQVDKKTLAIALKGTTQELQDAFFRNMSERAGDNLREEMDIMGPVKLKDVEDSQKEVVDAVRRLEEDGTISISGGADEYVL